MRIEALCTGDELLTGLTVDTNSPFFQTQLLERVGQRVGRLVIVGDVREDLVRALREASERSDAVLVSGGLGPTSDDLTAECAALAQGVPLVEDAQALASIKKRFEARSLQFTPNNAKQAWVPQGAEVVPNPVGSAPMFIQQISRCTFFYVPGVPREYRHLVENVVIPRLQARAEAEPGRMFRAFRLLKTIALPESHLDAKISPLLPLHPRVVFGYRTHAPENHLKLLAEAPSQHEADEALQAAVEASREVLATWLFGEGDETFTGTLGALLLSRGHTVACAESCTAGRVCDLLSGPPGASDYFLGGTVAYLSRLKQQWLGVSEATLSTYGAVSREVAHELAQGIRSSAGATYGLSTTGFAGPGGGTEKDPVGTVYCGLAHPDGVVVERHVVPGKRGLVRDFAAHHALNLLRRHLVGMR